MQGIDKHLRLMLQRYDAQLLIARRLVARRLAPLRRAQRRAENSHDAQGRRSQLVEMVAQELYERILYTDANSPVAHTIRQRLGERMGGPLRFAYPPGEDGLTMLPEEGKHALQGEERERALRALWRITVGAVDESML